LTFNCPGLISHSVCPVKDLETHFVRDLRTGFEGIHPVETNFSGDKFPGMNIADNNSEIGSFSRINVHEGIGRLVFAFIL
jgi:hypothetical protein